MNKKPKIVIIVILLSFIFAASAAKLQRTQLWPSTSRLQPSDDIKDPHIKEQFTKVKQWADKLQQMLDEAFRKISLNFSFYSKTSEGFRLGEINEPNIIFDETNNDISLMGGNVGIGTKAANPYSFFHLYTTTDPLNIWHGQAHFGGNSDVTNDIYMTLGINVTEEYVHFQAGKAEIYAIPIILNPGGGPVGIGTTDPNGLFEAKWAAGVEAYLGRGATDTDITFLMLRNADGEACYLYPNATQDGIVVSGTKP